MLDDDVVGYLAVLFRFRNGPPSGPFVVHSGGRDPER
jgi:hypothetical protein